MRGGLSTIAVGAALRRGTRTATIPLPDVLGEAGRGRAHPSGMRTGARNVRRSR